MNDKTITITDKTAISRIVFFNNKKEIVVYLSNVIYKDMIIYPAICFDENGDVKADRIDILYIKKDEIDEENLNKIRKMVADYVSKNDKC